MSEKKGRFIEDDFDLDSYRYDIKRTVSELTGKDKVILSILRFVILIVAVAAAYFSFSILQTKINEYVSNKYKNISMLDTENYALHENGLKAAGFVMYTAEIS